MEPVTISFYTPEQLQSTVLDCTCVPNKVACDYGSCSLPSPALVFYQMQLYTHSTSYLL